VDDFLILDVDKNRLFDLRNQIREFLQFHLKLNLHPKKSEYFSVDGGIDFLGYLVFKSYILLRKSTVKRFLKKLKKQLKIDSVCESRKNILDCKFQS